MVETQLAALAAIRDDSGVTMILAEQEADLALSFAEDAVVLDRGRAVFAGKSAELQADEALATPLSGGRRAIIEAVSFERHCQIKLSRAKRHVMAGHGLTLPRLRSAIGSPSRLGRSGALIASRNGVKG